MSILIASILIIVVTLLVWFLNKFWLFKICPICAGVSLTWILFLVAHFLWYSVDLMIPAILMGGSVVGIVYQIEKKINLDSKKQGILLIWKTFFFVGGFVAVSSILSELWTVFFIITMLLLLITFVFLISNKKETSNHNLPGKFDEASKKTQDELKKKMENCC